jgi:hypothetical protein
MAKPARRRSDNVSDMPVPELSVPETATLLNDGDIARRAFEIYCARGGENGRDLEDWLTAERELRTNPAWSAT